MNIVVFASDAKGLSSLNSIITELSERDHNIFAFITQDTQIRFPKIHKSSYKVLSNVESKETVYSKSLDTNLPFKPDWLIINRERWNPETEIIIEFKEKFGSKIGLVEPNAAMINAVEGFLETKSKNRFVKYIDVFFDHSEFISNQRNLLGFSGNSVVVGNPKYDINLEPNESVLTSLRKKYRVDPNKKQVLLFSLMNSSREYLFKEFEKYIEQNKGYQYFFKPYPGEPFEPQFHRQYFPEFFIEGVTPILSEPDIWGMFNLCDIHIGSFSSIFHSSYLLGKEVIDFSKEIGMRERFLDPSPILNSEGKGLEDKSELWMRVFNLKSIEELKNLLSEDVIKNISKDNNKVWNIVDSLPSLDTEDRYDEILNLFDSFNDKKSNKRIVDYLEQI